jgi:hypothetical protein
MMPRVRTCNGRECQLQAGRERSAARYQRDLKETGAPRNMDRWKIAKICRDCEQEFRTRHKSTQRCKQCSISVSVAASALASKARAQQRRALVPLFGPLHPFAGQSTALPTRHPARQDWSKSTGLTFVYGRCTRCGEAFMAATGRGIARYCSFRCLRNDGKDRRRAKERLAAGASVRRWEIFERDHWRCQLCGKKVNRGKTVPHPMAPVLDHILPLAALGRHDPSNVQCAHFLCNSIKAAGVHGAGEQLRLV